MNRCSDPDCVMCEIEVLSDEDIDEAARAFVAMYVLLDGALRSLGHER